ncbi:PAN2-PAN3 deadenylation complex catalytic subunit PAN2 isoform X2 [Cimex lectularius]|uniref:PAN2-PAN3 deadenylation complex catalytic subunit PAN2 n=1 Tax=Cimex lectularius TaxID=79782 RepID=A0A8I6RBP4_CIMLE|nr:PAN2-PAN3 deadenylation complex catalytic subunit PAN2 isoform X2 [Cimex lectularius]
MDLNADMSLDGNLDMNATNLPFEGQEEILLYDEDGGFALGDESFVSVSEPFTNEYDAEFHERGTILVDGGDNFGVSAVAFDTIEELIWMGNQGGHITSYYGPDMQKYTSFQVHMTDEIRCIHPIEGGILALSPTSLRYQMRRGLPIYTYSSANMEEMQCLINLKHIPDSFLIGGHTSNIIELNLAEGREVQLIDVGESGCAIMRQQSHYLCCGDPSGKIDLRDPISLKIEHSIESHSGSLSDFDVHGNLLVTCGFSNRNGSLVVDPLLLAYDLRMLRPVAPINVLIDPLLLKFMPSYSSRLAVASPTGQLQFVETVALSEPDLTLYQVNCDGAAIVTALDVSSSSQAVCIGETGGSLHLMTSVHTPVYNPFSRPTEFADTAETYETPVDVDDPMAVYAAIPLPITCSPLLSNWPEQFVKRRYRRTPPIDPEILRTMKMQGTVGYAPNPNTRRRNQVAEIYGGGVRRGLEGSRIGNSEEGSGFVAIPKRYRKPDIKYSKAGIDDAELEQFNKSGLSGLEATLPNSYCNSMIQLLYFTESLRSVMLCHQCCSEFCVCCELGFLFHMLGSGAPCHSGNLLRALRSAKEASALRLILSDSSVHDANLVLLIQSWNRFILHQMHSELLEYKRKETKTPTFVYRDTDFPSIELQNQRKRKVKPELIEELVEDTTKGETEVSRLFGSKQTHIFTCLKCNNKSSKDATLLVHNLIYNNQRGESRDVSFAEIIEGSVGGSQVTPAWCEPCHKFQPTLQERKVKTLPPILSVNCGNNNENDKKFWKEQMDAVVMKVLQGSGDMRTTIVNTSSGKQCRYGSSCTRIGCRFKHPQQTTELGGTLASHLYQNNSWVPMCLDMHLSVTGEVRVTKHGEEVKQENPDEFQEKLICTYDLYGVVCFINDERKNIVSIVNICNEPKRNGEPQNPQWYIFNDFSITPVPYQEAVWFSMDWKIPCVFYFKQRTDYPSSSMVVQIPISPDVLINVPKCATIIPLSPQEIPKKGDLVAIDAEFVTLNQEESELRSDGKLATVKPSHMSVARISCVRGQGPLEGTAFIDDYISTQEQVFDYLTKFSGIKPGDLDATCSSKNLTTLKSTYSKIRYLIDNGVVFVGHGLNNDFRVINVVVPAEQVIDTVQLFYLPHQRMVSLRFLAWHFIGIKIQAGTHDSIEDARAALQLYKKYLQLESQGILKSSLEEMYSVGKSLHWKVPGVDDDV